MKLHKLLVLLAFSVLLVSCASVASAQNLGVGTRALGMGGAYTAIADDESAAFWNPAGLAKVTRFHMLSPNFQVKVKSSLDLQDIISDPPTGTDARIKLLEKIPGTTTEVFASANLAITSNNFSVFVLPEVEATLDATHVTLKDLVIGGVIQKRADGSVIQTPTADDYAEVNAKGFISTGIGFARKVGNKSSIGLTLKSMELKGYYTKTVYTPIDPTPTEIANNDLGDNNIWHTDTVGNKDTVESKSGLGMDLGFQSDVSPKTSIGIVMRNIISPSLTTANGLKVSPKRSLNAGMVYAPNSNLLLAVDICPQINLGAEFKAGKALRLWTGVYQSNLTLGFGLKMLGADIRYAYSPSSDKMVSTSISF